MSAVLAQFNIADASAIPPLDPPPLAERILLDNPWPTVALLVLLAVILFFAFRARARARSAVVAAAALLLTAVAAFSVARLVRTDREELKSRTRALVAATASVDAPALDRMLDDHLVARVTRLPPDAGKAETITAVRKFAGEVYHVRDVDILELQAQTFGPDVGRTQVRLRVTTDFGLWPSWWRIDWRRRSGHIWTATRIEALWIAGIPNPAG